jgi:hypothetical protein
MKQTYLIASLSYLISLSAIAQEQELLSDFPEVMDGSVQVITIDEENDRILLGGNFSQLRKSENIPIPFLNSIALNEESTPLVLPALDGEVMNVVGDGQGGAFISGDFTKVGNFDRNGLAHINSNGQVTALDIAINGSVYDIMLDLENDVLYIGGEFSEVNGVVRENLCALNSGTFDVLPFDPLLNGPVYDIEQESGILYLAGGFTGAGELAKEFLIYNEVTEEALAPFVANGDITDVVEDGNGGFFLLGNFTTVGDSLRNAIAHVDSEGQPTDWNVNLEAASPLSYTGVNSVLLLGDTLYLGGSFSSVNGANRRNVAAVNAMTGSVLPWNPKAKIVDSSSRVFKIDLLNDSILIAGNFNRMNNELIKHLALVDRMQGNVSLDFDTQLDEEVRNFEIQGNYLHLIGQFNEVFGIERERFCTIDLASWTLPFDQIPIFSGGSEDIVAIGDTIFLGGTFSRPGFSNAAFGAFRRSTSEWIETNLETKGAVFDLELQGDKLYISGRFRKIGAETREYFASIDVQTLEINEDAFSFSGDSYEGVVMVKKIGDLLYLSSSANRIHEYRRHGLLALSVSGEVNELSIPINLSEISTSPAQDFIYEAVCDIEIANDKIYLSGNFTGSPQLPHKFLVSADKNTGELVAFIADLDQPVRSLAADEEKLYFAGEFTMVNGEATPLLSRIDLATNEVDAWPTPNFVEGNKINDVIVSDENILIAGDFLSVGGTTRNNFAAFDKNNLELSDTRPDPDDEVFAIYENNGIVTIGGAFTEFNANPVFETELNFAVIEKSSGAVTDVQLFPNGTVYDIVLTDDLIILAGAFTQVGDSLRSGIAALDRQTLEVAAWGHDLNATIDNFVIYDIEANEDRLYYTGFIKYEGNNEAGIGALTLESGELEDWPQPDLLTPINTPGNNTPQYYALAVSDSTVFIGGEFRVHGPNNPPPFFQFSSIVEIDKATGISTSFAPTTLDNDIIERIRDIEIFEGDLYIAGFMFTSGPIFSDRGETIGRIVGSTGQFTSIKNASIPTGGDQPFNSSLFVQGKDIFINDSLLYFASEAFSAKYSFDAQSYETVYSSTDWYELTCCQQSTFPRWDPIVSANAIAADSEGTVYIGGNFNDIIGQPRLGFAAIIDVEPTAECDPLTAGTATTSSITSDICLNNEVLDIVQAEVTENTGNSIFILHDSDYNVFSARLTGTFKPDNHPAGNYFVSHVAYAEDNLAQVTNLNNLDGCVAFSNSFPVTSFQAEAGTISTGDPKNYCVADLPATIHFDRTGSSGPNQGFALLNGSNQIIEISDDGTFLLDDLNLGTYKVASISTDETLVLEDIQVNNLDLCFDYSNVIKVKIKACEELLISSNPNPVVDISNVTFTTLESENVQLEVFDLTGRRLGLIYAGTAESQVHYNFQFDTSHLPQGIYIYKLSTGSEVKTVKFLKN